MSFVEISTKIEGIFLFAKSYHDIDSFVFALKRQQQQQLQYVHHIFELLPTLTCWSPRDSLYIIRGRIAGEHNILYVIKQSLCVVAFLYGTALERVRRSCVFTHRKIKVTGLKLEMPIHGFSRIQLISTFSVWNMVSIFHP